MSAIWIGLIAGVVCAFAVSLKFRLGFDDSLDVVGVHIVGGLVGSLLIGLFAHPGALGEFKNGLFYGGGLSLLGEQALANAVTIVFSFVVTFAILKVLDVSDRGQGVEFGRERRTGHLPTRGDGVQPR